jgi:hypothetical protein
MEFFTTPELPRMSLTSRPVERDHRPARMRANDMFHYSIVGGQRYVRSPLQSIAQRSAVHSLQPITTGSFRHYKAPNAPRIVTVGTSQTPRLPVLAANGTAHAEHPEKTVVARHTLRRADQTEEVHPINDDNIKFTQTKGHLKIQLGCLPNLPTPKGVDVGKAILNYFAEHYFKTGEKPVFDTVTLDCVGPVNFQFPSFYLAFPPNAPEGLLPQIGKLEIRCHTLSACHQICDVASNTMPKSLGFLQQITKTPIEIVLPREAAPLLDRRIEETWQRFQETFHLDRELETDLRDFLTKPIFRQEEMPMLPEPHIGRQKTVHPHKSSLTAIDLLTGSTYYVGTDELSIAFLSDSKKVLNIMDAGSDIMDDVIDNLTRFNPHLKKVRLFISHFHDDHSQNLIKIMKAANRNHLEIEWVIPEAAKRELFGYLCAHLDDISELFTRSNPHATIILEDGQQASTSPFSFFNVQRPPDELTHFIPSREIYHYDDQEGLGRIWLSDSNAQIGQDQEVTRLALIRQFTDCTFRMAETARAGNTPLKGVDIYYDAGHYVGIDFNQIVEAAARDARVLGIPRLQFIPIHNKANGAGLGCQSHTLH